MIRQTWPDLQQTFELGVVETVSGRDSGKLVQPRARHRAPKVESIERPTSCRRRDRGRQRVGAGLALRLADDGRAIAIWDRDVAGAKRTVADLEFA